ncbi:MAG: orotate phosphoribosyltransferase [Armatimonadetes bacterium]|nr:orotate phosphoribosyltransferase [Armatimonadota bacterium]
MLALFCPNLRQNTSVTKVDLGRLLEESGAILRGHFILASGRHSEVYFEKFRVIERPDVLSALCSEIAEAYKDLEFDYVCGPTTGGIIIAFEVGRQMGKPAVYAETENGVKTLRRGKTIPTGSRVLIVDDVLTTGKSLFETRDAIVRAGGTPVAYAVLVNRAQVRIDAEPLFSAYTVEAVSYAEDEIPEWLNQIPPVKPGTSVFK